MSSLSNSVDSPVITVSHPTGNQNLRQVLIALEDADLVSEFVTTVASFPGDLMSKLARFGMAAEFSRRRFEGRIRGKTVQHPWRELGRVVAGRLGLSGLIAHEKGYFCIDNIYRAQDRLVASRLRKGGQQWNGVYCYEDGALETFRAAKERGIRCLYDLPIGYWRAARRIQSEEAERMPDWAGTMPALIDSDEKLARKDEELKLADTILVASSFTAQTLREAPFDHPTPVVTAYGCPEVNTNVTKSSDASEKLKVLFVGGLSQRKGLAYLFEAVDSIQSEVELTVIGRKPPVECAPLEQALSRYRWIDSLPHSSILEQMRAHDVFVFPSLFEGFGLVITEALSQGMPVIATPHTCGPDILSDGEDGFIVPIRDSVSIREKLLRLARDRELLQSMRLAAVRKADSLTWDGYRSSVIEAIRQPVSPATR